MRDVQGLLKERVTVQVVQIPDAGGHGRNARVRTGVKCFEVSVLLLTFQLTDFSCLYQRSDSHMRTLDQRRTLSLGAVCWHRAAGRLATELDRHRRVDVCPADEFHWYDGGDTRSAAATAGCRPRADHRCIQQAGTDARRGLGRSGGAAEIVWMALPVSSGTGIFFVTDCTID